MKVLSPARSRHERDAAGRALGAPRPSAHVPPHRARTLRNRSASRGFFAVPLASTLGALLCCVLASGCCLLVRPPNARELLDVGFQTPEQAFATLQVGWRAEEPDLERRCFSRGFRERNQVSKFNYRLVRARLVEDEPFLRLGITDAELAGPAEIHGARALLVAKSHGRRLEVRLVQDDVIEVWAGDRRVVDEYAPFDEHTQTRDAEGAGARLLWAHVELPAGAEPGAISEVRLAREWKIDDLRLLDAAPKSAP